MSGAAKHIGLVAVGGKNWMGGANYVRNLAAALREASAETRVSFIVGKPIAPEWAEVRPRHVVSHEGFLGRLLGGARALDRVVQGEGIDFLYPFTYDNEYNLGLRWPLAPSVGGAAWAGWVPDFQHRHLPAFFSSEEIDRRDVSIGKLVEEAPRIVFSSESAAEDFRAFYPAHSDKAVVWRFAVPPPEIADVPCDAPRRFFIVCNQFWAHKNHLVVFEALRILKERGVRPVVLCTGQLEDYRDGSFAEKIRGALDGLGDQVQLLGLLPRAKQLALLRRTVAVIQPSLFEGWSTVVEDCRALGRPSLLSGLAVHREQNPPGARYFDPRSAEELAGLMAEAWASWPEGPDLAAEAAAREAAREIFVDAGRRFLATVAALA